MSKPQPPFFDLEFSGNADFWAGSPGTPRHAFLMPVKAPAEFLAFGVVEPSKQVCFVARGRLKDHLAAFIARMSGSGTQVGLYVRAPVPASLLKRYAAGPPIEGQESEDPPEPPVLGLAPEGAVPYAGARATLLWNEGEISSRRVLLTPTNAPAEFLALGVLVSAGKVLFKLTGLVQEHLGELVIRMVQDGARVELYARLPTLG